MNPSLSYGTGRDKEPSPVQYLSDYRLPYQSFIVMSEYEAFCDPGMFIVSYWSTGYLKDGYHTVAIKYDGNTFVGYNVNTWSDLPTKPMGTLYDFFDEGRFISGFYIPFS